VLQLSTVFSTETCCIGL